MRPIFLLALLCASRGAIADDGLTGAPVPERLAGTVLVWEDATLFTEPDGGGQAIQLAKLDGTRARSLGRAFPMHVVGANKDWVEVELHSELACVPDFISSDVAQLRLFVHRADLAPVITQPVRHRAKDGSGIRLTPGVPVLPVETGARVRVLDDMIDVATTAIGHAYRPTTRALTDGGSPGADFGDVTGTVEGQPVHLTAATPYLSVDKRGKIALVHVGDACMEATIAVPASAIEHQDVGDVWGEGGIGQRGVGPVDRDYWWVPKGTPLATPSGRKVGALSRDLEVPAPDAQQATSCRDFPIELAIHLTAAPMPAKQPAALQLCVATKAVRHHPRARHP